MSLSKKQIKYEKKLCKILSKRGYAGATKIVNTLQGTIWRAKKQPNNKRVVIKITSKELSSKQIIIVDGIEHKIDENILMEKTILEYLSNDPKCPQSIVKYAGFMKSNVSYYLVMEDGGHSLFDFNVKVHNYIECEKISISEYHNVVKILFAQMIDSLDYIHRKSVCHFDVSLENMLVNDIDVVYGENTQLLKFCYDQTDTAKSILCTLCDFGLAQMFIPNGEEKKSDFMSDRYCGKLCYQSPEISNQKKAFNAQKNDIWCLGVCLFMLITGNAPFQSTVETDKHFQVIMKGGMAKLLERWDRLQYVNDELIELFEMIFKYEDERADIEQIKSCKWLQ